jgi:threonine/homoserine/homoserine lactone efflux protein
VRGYAAMAGYSLLLALSTNAMFRSLQKAALDRLDRLGGVLLIILGTALCARMV